MSAEEERLQRFWHDYYDALRRYYGALDHIDWVAYYKNHGYQINAGCGGPAAAAIASSLPRCSSARRCSGRAEQLLNGPPAAPPYPPMAAFPGAAAATRATNRASHVRRAKPGFPGKESRVFRFFRAGRLRNSFSRGY